MSMRFTRMPRAEKIVAEMLGRPSQMRMYGAHAGRWQFSICYDEMRNRWTATYKAVRQTKQAIPLGDEVLPGWENSPSFATQAEAEQACRDAWKLLRAKARETKQ